jgi:pyroglutamyl-peptidase
MSTLKPLVLVTGFGPFLDVTENPSGALAARLEATPPPGLRVRHRVLPVTFAGVPRAFAEFVAEPESQSPALILSIGVHRGPSFRFEQNARERPIAGRPDNDGSDGGDLRMDKARATSIDVPALARALSATSQALGIPIEISSDAGGYVCDWTYQHALRLGELLRVPAFFLHVPPLVEQDVDAQWPFVSALVTELVRSR